MSYKFKVGDKVRLKKGVAGSHAFDDYGSGGEEGITYEIGEVTRHDFITYRLRNSNWHKEEWLVPIITKNVVGGNLL